MCPRTSLNSKLQHVNGVVTINHAILDGDSKVL